MKPISTVFLAATLAFSAGTVRAEDLAIVVAPGVPLANLSLAEALRIFQCQTTKLPDGTALKIVTRERGSPERNALLAGVYNFNDAAYEKFFMQAVFTAQA